MFIIWADMKLHHHVPVPADMKHKPKTCEHMYIKGWRANTQCIITVKGEGYYCSKHKRK